MRWTRQDTEAYGVVNRAGQQLRDAWEKKMAGDAYNEGVAGLGPQDKTLIDDNRAAGEMINEPVQARDGTFHQPDAQAQDEMRGYTAAANGGLTRQYGRDQRKAGYAAQAAHYAGRGDTVNAGLMQDRVEGMDDKDWEKSRQEEILKGQKQQWRQQAQLFSGQLKQQGLSINKGEREEADAALRTEITTAILGGTKGILEFYNNGGVPNGHTARIVPDKKGTGFTIVESPDDDPKQVNTIGKYANSHELQLAMMEKVPEFMTHVADLRQKAAALEEAKRHNQSMEGITGKHYDTAMAPYKQAQEDAKEARLISDDLVGLENTRANFKPGSEQYRKITAHMNALQRKIEVLMPKTSLTPDKERVSKPYNVKVNGEDVSMVDVDGRPMEFADYQRLLSVAPPTAKNASDAAATATPPKARGVGGTTGPGHYAPPRADPAKQARIQQLNTVLQQQGVSPEVAISARMELDQLMNGGLGMRRGMVKDLVDN